jgi:hypothetical protein
MKTLTLFPGSGEDIPGGESPQKTILPSAAETTAPGSDGGTLSGSRKNQVMKAVRRSPSTASGKLFGHRK